MKKIYRRRKRKSKKIIIGIATFTVLFCLIGIFCKIGIISFGNETPDASYHNDTNDQIVLEEDVQPEDIPSTSKTDIVDNTEPSTTSGTIQSEIQENPVEDLPVESETELSSESVNDSNTGIIYLTFDDGPSNLTSQYLDILKEKNVKATFFIVDYNSLEYEDIVKREFTDGHTIGLHGISHDYSKIYSSLDSLISNFTLLQEKVFLTTGNYSYIIRFPGGSSNTVSRKYCEGIMSQAAQYFTDNNFHYFDWNIDSDDAGKAKTSEEIYQNVTSALIPNSSNVVLMHDSSTKQATLDALSSIIDFGIENGYTFEAISFDTPQIKHGINN